VQLVALIGNNLICSSSIWLVECQISFRFHHSRLVPIQSYERSSSA
jgi:hypothetical protein